MCNLAPATPPPGRTLSRSVRRTETYAVSDHASAPYTLPPTTGRPPVLLLIEHEPGLRTLLRIALGAYGYQVREAASGTEGLWLAAQQRPDLLIAASSCRICMGRI